MMNTSNSVGAGTPNAQTLTTDTHQGSQPVTQAQSYDSEVTERIISRSEVAETPMCRNFRGVGILNAGTCKPLLDKINRMTPPDRESFFRRCAILAALLKPSRSNHFMVSKDKVRGLFPIANFGDDLFGLILAMCVHQNDQSAGKVLPNNFQHVIGNIIVKTEKEPLRELCEEIINRVEREPACYHPSIIRAWHVDNKLHDLKVSESDTMVTMDKSSLAGQNFENNTAEKVIFATDLRNTHFKSSKIFDCVFTRDISGAYFDRVRIIKTTFPQDLSSIHFNRSVIAGCDWGEKSLDPNSFVACTLANTSLSLIRLVRNKPEDYEKFAAGIVALPDPAHKISIAAWLVGVLATYSTITDDRLKDAVLRQIQNVINDPNNHIQFTHDEREQIAITIQKNLGKMRFAVDIQNIRDLVARVITTPDAPAANVETPLPDVLAANQNNPHLPVDVANNNVEEDEGNPPPTGVGVNNTPLPHSADMENDLL